MGASPALSHAGASVALNPHHVAAAGASDGAVLARHLIVLGLETRHTGYVHHSAAETQNKVKRRIFLDVVIAQKATFI